MIKILAQIGIGGIWTLVDNATDRQYADLLGFLAGVAAVYVWQA